jgi:hypothetical protein
MQYYALMSPPESYQCRIIRTGGLEDWREYPPSGVNQFESTSPLSSTTFWQTIRCPFHFLTLICSVSVKDEKNEYSRLGICLHPPSSSDPLIARPFNPSVHGFSEG